MAKTKLKRSRLIAALRRAVETAETPGSDFDWIEEAWGLIRLWDGRKPAKKVNVFAPPCITALHAILACIEVDDTNEALENRTYSIEGPINDALIAAQEVIAAHEAGIPMNLVEALRALANLCEEKGLYPLNVGDARHALKAYEASVEKATCAGCDERKKVYTRVESGDGYESLPVCSEECEAAVRENENPEVEESEEPMVKGTPRPWKVSARLNIVGADSTLVATTNLPEGDDTNKAVEDAELIVKAVNAYKESGDDARDQVKDLRVLLEVWAADTPIEGFQVKVGRATYGTTATFQIEFQPIAADGTVSSKEEEAYRLLAPTYGLKAEWFGQEFERDGEMFVISGCAPKSTRFPILVRQVSTGKGYKLPAAAISTGFGVPPTPEMLMMARRQPRGRFPRDF